MFVCANNPSHTFLAKPDDGFCTQNDCKVNGYLIHEESEFPGPALLSEWEHCLRHLRPFETGVLAVGNGLLGKFNLFAWLAVALLLLTVYQGWLFWGSILVGSSAVAAFISAKKKNSRGKPLATATLLGAFVCFGLSFVQTNRLAAINNWYEELTKRSSTISNSETTKITFDEFDGKSIGTATGIEYERTPNGLGAVFSRENNSRIEYHSQIPDEGTLEWRIKVESGFYFKDSRLYERQASALIFTTAGPDVWYPGSTWLTVKNDGTITLDMATTKGDGPKQTLVARGTGFGFGQWHSIGITYGRRGQQIRVNGAIVASAPQNTIKLSTGGNHSRASDVPTIGKMRSVFWSNNQFDSGFDGVVDRFRISGKQMDWLF